MNPSNPFPRKPDLAHSLGNNPVSSVSGSPSSRSSRSTAWNITIAFGVLILTPSLLGFVIKFRELVALTGGSSDAGGFAITPVINYLLASIGFFLLLMWAAVNGMFRDLERPKYLMLEREQELDAHV